MGAARAEAKHIPFIVGYHTNDIVEDNDYTDCTGVRFIILRCLAFLSLN